LDSDRFIDELRKLHRQGGGPENLLVLPVVASTNGFARLIATEYQDASEPLYPLVILAYGQSGGRGRQGRSWSSPAGKGAYVTRVIGTDDPALLQTLPLLVGVGLCRALAAHLPVPCRLKWPNDLVVEVESGGRPERRKIGGILIEALVRPGERSLALAGFGINLFHTAAELPETATSLALLGDEGSQEEGGAALAALAWSLVRGVEAELAHLGDVAYAVASYRPLAVHQPGERLVSRVGETATAGAFAGFDETGRLLLDSDSDGRRIVVAAGEVIEE
jgi:BirA family biotin operon repressor/biotin-[acetyl-CoA-carboxylase] ligase